MMRYLAVGVWVLLAPIAPARAAPPATPAGSGAKLFDVHCGICHAPHGAGTIALDHRLGEEHSLLAERTDLDADYIRHVVRNGIGSMPPQTRVDLTDAELDSVAAYLTRPAGERARPQGSGHD